MKTMFLPLLLAAFPAWQLHAEDKDPLRIPESIPAEVREALTWYQTLDLPTSSGLQRVRVTDTYTQLDGERKQIHHLDAWLMEEKNGKWRLLCGPDAEGPFWMDADTPWPMEEWIVSPHSRTDNGWKSERRIEKSDFKAEADALLAAINQPYDPKKDFRPKPDRFGKVLSGRAATFLIGLDCLRHNLPDEGLALLKKAPPMMRDVSEKRAFRALLEEEFARAALWRITLRFSIPDVSRETLLTEIEAALKRFPGAPLNAMAERLRRMIAEDREHAAKAKPFEHLTPAEQAAELVFQLRNQTGRQDSQPGQCDIFSVGFAGGFAGPRNGKVNDSTPAGKLVMLGYEAVPALIEALPNETYSRAVGFWRDFTFSHHVLTVGDCAQQILEVIAGRSFYVRTTTSGYMSTDEKAAATKKEVEKWWNGVKDKGERQALIDAVLAGDENSSSQAERLKERFPDDAAATLLKAAIGCNEAWPRTALIQLLHDVKTEPVTAFLRNEMTAGAHHESRMAALALMLERDREAARKALLTEWNRLTSQFTGDEKKHVMLNKLIGENREFDASDWQRRMEALLQTIYLSGGAETIGAVAATYFRKPAWIRSAMIQSASADELRRAANGSETLPESEQARVDATMENMLLKALDDRTDRLCDDAAEILHERRPDKFAWEKAESLRRRDAEIIGMKNVQRRELGQPALALPEPVKIPAADEAATRTLLDSLAKAHDDEAIAASVDALAAGPGLFALPFAVKRRDALPKDDPQAARWQRATAVLSAIVRTVETDQKAEFIGNLPEVAALKGKVLTAELLQKTLIALFLATPDTVAGYHFRAYRDDDGAGFVIRITALTEKSSRSRDWWALWYAGNLPCRDMDGEGRGFYGNDFTSQGDDFHGLKDAFTNAATAWDRPVYVNYRAARQEQR